MQDANVLSILFSSNFAIRLNLTTQTPGRFADGVLWAHRSRRQLPLKRAASRSRRIPPAAQSSPQQATRFLRKRMPKLREARALKAPLSRAEGEPNLVLGGCWVGDQVNLPPSWRCGSPSFPNASVSWSKLSPENVKEVFFSPWNMQEGSPFSFPFSPAPEQVTKDEIRTRAFWTETDCLPAFRFFCLVLGGGVARGSDCCWQAA